MRSSIKDKIDKLRKRAAKKKFPIIYPPKQRAAPKPLLLNKISDHPDWADIQASIISTEATATAICRQFDLRNSYGNYAITQVLKYRKGVQDKFPDLFQQLNQMRREALMEEYLEGIRTSLDQADETREIARDSTRYIKKGKELIEVSDPNFTGMVEAQKLRLETLGKMAVVVGATPNQINSQNNTVNNTKITVLSLPKSSSAPTLAALPSPQNVTVIDTTPVMDVADPIDDRKPNVL